MKESRTAIRAFPAPLLGSLLIPGRSGTALDRNDRMNLGNRLSQNPAKTTDGGNEVNSQAARVLSANLISSLVLRIGSAPQSPDLAGANILTAICSPAFCIDCWPSRYFANDAAWSGDNRLWARDTYC